MASKREEKIKTHTRTIRLKTNVKWTKEEWQMFNNIHNNVWRAANEITGGQYWNDILVRKVYARKMINTKDMEQVRTVENQFQDFFGVKRQATTERDVKAAFPMLPPSVTNPLNQIVVTSYKANKKEMLTGNQSLRTYKEGMPIPIVKKAIKFDRENGADIFTWSVRRGVVLKFKIYYGADRANFKSSIDRILKGEYSYSVPQIQKKDREIYLLLPVVEPLNGQNIVPGRCIGVDLGIAVPAYVANADGLKRKPIGNKNDFLRVRLRIQNQRSRLQRGLQSTTGGKGRQKKLKALKRIKAKERNFVQMYNHRVSKRVVDFAKENRAETIKMEFLKGFGDNRQQNDLILRNWSYFELQSQIKYKAKAAGIKAITIDPYRTSKTCSKCGYYEEGQRIKREFKCRQCEEEMNADYNAAINIARSKKSVSKIEQCEYYKNNNNPEKAGSAGPTAKGGG